MPPLPTTEKFMQLMKTAYESYGMKYIPEEVKQSNLSRWLSPSAVDETLYHSTRSDIRRFKTSPLGSHFGTLEAAQDRLNQFWETSADAVKLSRSLSEEQVKRFRELAKKGQDVNQALSPLELKEMSDLGDTGQNILPVHLRITNPLRLPDVGDWDSPRDILPALRGRLKRHMGVNIIGEDVAPVITRVEADTLKRRHPNVFKRKDTSKGYEGYFAARKGDKAALRDIKKLIESKGYDGIVYTNVGEDVGSDSYIAFSSPQIKSLFNQGTYSKRTGDILRGLAIAGSGATLASLLSPKEAEAAGPKTRVAGEAWKVLQEKAWPIAKEMLEAKGPVEFDVKRRYWSKKLAGAGLFWNQARDEKAFLNWVTPYVNKAIEISPQEGQTAKGLIEMSLKEGRPRWFELALQRLHRILTHDAPSTRAAFDLLQEYPSKDVRDALLSQAPKGEPRDALKATIDYIWNFGLPATVGLGALLGSRKEAEAGPGLKVPKALTEAILKKIGPLSSANARLQGMELLGKTIKSVHKGAKMSPWRYILFEDGTGLVLHKDYIASLTSAEGEKAYSSMFEMLGNKAQKEDMLRRSHAIREADRTPRMMHKRGLQYRERLLKELGEEAPKRMSTTVGGKKILVPETYGEWIAKRGMPSKRAGKSSVRKAITMLEDLSKKRALSDAETYILRRLRGTAPVQAKAGLRGNSDAWERLVQKMLGEAK